MIQLHILTTSETQAVHIAKILLSENLAVDVHFERVVLKQLNEQGELFDDPKVKIMAKTKSLLFSQINQLIRTHYSSQMPGVWSTPIVNCDPEEELHIRESTRKV
jgi:uncharacterized protein involved in tolerance to divalent cations